MTQDTGTTISVIQELAQKDMKLFSKRVHGKKSQILKKYKARERHAE
jgi:hypothetical protein